MKTCSKCHIEKPLEEFYKDRSAKDGLDHRCKVCAKEKSRLWAAKNPGSTAKKRARLLLTDPEKVKEDDARWYRRKRVNPLSRVVRRQVLEAYPTCCNCESTENLSVDHIKPQSEGGTNDWDNLQVLCVLCNSRKFNKTIDYRKNPVAQPEGVS